MPLAVYVWVRRSDLSAPRVPLVSALVVAVSVLTMAYDDVAFLDVTSGSYRPSPVGAVMLLFALWVPVSGVHHAVVLGVASSYLTIGAVIAHALGVYPEADTGSVVISAVAASIPTWVCGILAGLFVARREQDRRRFEATLRDLENLGGYTLRTKLGAGGMGEVWRADHAFLARPAAIKIIRPEVLGGLNGQDAKAHARAQLALGRLEREAKATAQLTSSHTVRVFDFGRGTNSTFFYAMELLDGLDLQSLVVRFGPQPQERVVHILLQVCDSLAEAHDRGMVHRDIKPANIFLCRLGKTLDHVKVLDFGLVRSDPLSKPDDVDTLPRLTRQGIISGSPSFMSPEQAGGSEDLDRRADIYALGCVTYFLLTGSAPFRADNPMLVLMQQVSDAPKPMRERRPQIRLEPELEALVNRMLVKRREDRISSADALAEQLRGLRLRKTWDQELAGRWWSRAKVSVVVDAEVGPESAAGQRFVRKLT